MWPGKFFYKKARQYNQAGGCGDAHNTSTGCQAHDPVTFVQFVGRLSMLLTMFDTRLDQFDTQKVSRMATWPYKLFFWTVSLSKHKIAKQPYSQPTGDA